MARKSIIKEEGRRKRKEQWIGPMGKGIAYWTLWRRIAISFKESLPELLWRLRACVCFRRVIGAYVVLMERAFLSSGWRGLKRKRGLNDVNITIVNVETPLESDIGADVHANADLISGNKV
ncbi:hypothetical protein Tco_1021021 [Tanacetum coccineum]